MTDKLTLEQRLARVESQLEIQQLPIRYALAVDGRDLDSLAGLFVEDVNCGRWGTGRDALKTFYGSEHILQAFYRSIHQICGHAVNFTDETHAEGRVYCRAEHEDRGHWVVMAICYFDSYEKRGDHWYFVRRDERHWYSTDWLERPGDPTFQNWPGRGDNPKHAPRMPGSFPEWETFWREVDRSVINRLTRDSGLD